MFDAVEYTPIATAAKRNHQAQREAGNLRHARANV